MRAREEVKDKPCEMMAWTLLAPLSRSDFAAKVSVLPVSIMSSTTIATYQSNYQ